MLRILLFLTIFLLPSVAMSNLLVGMTAYHFADYEIAFDNLMPYAKVDNPEALYLVAKMYKHGLGIEKDPKKSFQYMQRAAELGVAQAKQHFFCKF